MNKKLLTLFTIILFNTHAFAKYKVVASITPLASIAAMLLGDAAEITAIASSNSCPHHFHPTPGNLQSVNDADVNIYIDENFDGFAYKLMKNNKGTIVEIANIKTLSVIRDNQGPNWHIWLDLNNTRAILKELASVFSIQFPDLKKLIEINLEKSLVQIAILSEAKLQKLSQLKNKIILMSDSLEYFFVGKQNITKLYEPEHKSLKFIKTVDNILADRTCPKCLILSIDQNIQKYEKYKFPIIQMESENWKIDKNIQDLYFNKYLKMIDQLHDCLHD